MTALEIINVNYSYHTKKGETPALKDINLTVKKGEFISIVGPSGCGKSTLLSLIAGLIPPESGTITSSDTNIGYMLQHDHLFEWRTVYNNIRLGLNIHKKKDIDGKADRFLRQYGLIDFKNSRPSQLSGGMRQRVALIRTLMLDPEILLLDEPFSALDYQTRLAVCDDISSIIRQEGKTALLVTHDLAEAISAGDYVYVLSKRPGHFVKTIKMDFPKEMTPFMRRNSPQFNTYLNMLWKEMSDNAG